MLATGLVALAAPLIFSTVLEYPLLVALGTGVLAILARPGSLEIPGRPCGPAWLVRRLAPYAVVAGLLYDSLP